ncbi:MAG: GNAT family protein [Patescibacteria group bacterium]|jgi:RimJ/RimL family protein N-acetyltransferase
MNYVIKTKRFILRPVRLSDAKSMVANINDKEISRQTLNIPYPYTLRDANKWLKRKTSYYRKAIPPSIPFAIEIDKKMAGCVDLMHFVPRHKSELGYWLGRGYRGQGIMTAAVREVVALAFNKLRLKRVYAYTFPANKVSARVLQKNNFCREGVLRNNVVKKGTLLDDVIWAKVK